MDKFIVQYYHLTMDVPSEIILPCKINSLDNIRKWLFEKFNKKISILSPLRGNKKNILQVCIKNNDLKLKEMLFRKIKRKEYIPKILSELKDSLNMSVVPRRIEALDNSNINGITLYVPNQHYDENIFCNPNNAYLSLNYSTFISLEKSRS